MKKSCQSRNLFNPFQKFFIGEGIIGIQIILFKSSYSRKGTQFDVPEII